MRTLAPIDEDLVRRLPLPLAQLYRRAHNAKTALERHLTAFYLWEAGLKLLASVAIVEYARRPAPDPKLAEQLESLSRPSLGHWWMFVRLLLPVLAEPETEREGPFRGIRDLVLGRARDDLPLAAGLEAVLAEVLEGKGGHRAAVKLGLLFDRLVQVRNEEMGHGATGQKPASYYQRLGPALLAGIAQVLSRLDVLAGRRLVQVSDVRRLASGAWLLERYELIGENPRRLESLEMPGDQAARLPRPGRLYLHTTGSLGQAADDCALHPLVLFDSDTAQFFFLNASRGQRKADYLCYATGEVVRREELGEDQRALLTHVLGSPVDARMLDAWAAQVQAEEAPAPAEVGPRHHVGEFELLTRIGAGGMGKVYRAWQPSLGRQVALKCLKSSGDPKAEVRFRREIRALGKVEHPNLVKIFTSGADGEEWFYAMELVEGADLAAVCQHLAKTTAQLDEAAWSQALTTACGCQRQAEQPLGKDGPVPAAPIPEDVPGDGAAVRIGGRGYLDRTVEIIRQVAEAAHALHEAGVLHRDIKPGNIMVAADGRHAVLMDLGLAQMVDDEEGRLTRTRQFVGTLRYASPEQLGGAPLDRRADIYSLGATLWELLTLRPLFGVTDQTPTPELVLKIQQAEPDRPRKYQPAVPRDLDAIVLKCLEKNPAGRYASARELADDLGRFLAGEPVLARPVSDLQRFGRLCRRNPWISGLSAALVLALAAGVAISAWKWSEAEREKDDKELANQALVKQGQSLAALNTNLEQAINTANAAAAKEKALLAAATLAAAKEKALRENLETANYRSSILLADREWLAGNALRAEEHLNRLAVPSRGWEWYYLRRLCQEPFVRLRDLQPDALYSVAISPDGRWLASGGNGNVVVLRNGFTLTQGPMLRGHKERIRALAFSPDAKLLASGSDDATVKVWNLEKQQVIQTFDRHKEGLRCVAFFPDGQKLASIDKGGTIRVWDTKSGTESYTCSGAPRAFASIAISPNGRLLAAPARGTEHVIHVWDATSGVLQFALYGHINEVNAVAFNPSGGLLASGGTDHKVILWDVAKKEIRRTCSGYDSTVLALAFHPNGRSIAGTGLQDTIQVWEVSTGRALGLYRGQTDSVLGVAYSSDGEYIASAGMDGSVNLWATKPGSQLLGEGYDLFLSVAFDPHQRYLAAGGTRAVYLWDAATRQPVTQLDHQVRVGSLAFSADGKLLAAGEGYTDGAVGGTSWPVVVWDVESRSKYQVFQGHSEPVTGVAFRGSSLQLASASRDKTVQLWNVTTGQVIRTFPHPDQVWAVAFRPDGQVMATAGMDKVIRLWDPVSGASLGELRGHGRSVRCLCWSPDGTRLASGDGNFPHQGTVIVWDAVARQELRRLGTKYVARLAFHPDGRRLAVCGAEQVVQVWDTSAGHELLSLHGHTTFVQDVAFNPDGSQLASAGTDALRLWDASPTGEVFTLRGHFGNVNSVAFRHDGKWLASASSDETVRLWDVTSGLEVMPTLKSDAPLTCVAFSTDDRYLAFAGGKTVKIHEVATGHLVQSLQHAGPIYFVAFSPSGRLLATAGQDQAIWLWDPSTWTHVGTLSGHKGPIGSLAFSADGKLLASGSLDKTIKIWDPITAKELQTLVGHADTVQEVSFRPDGQRLASCGKDRTVRLWNVATGVCTRTLEGHLASVWSVAYHPSAKWLLSCDEVGAIKVWEAETGRELITLRGHGGSVANLMVSPDGRFFATGGRDQTARLWDIRYLDAESGRRVAQRDQGLWWTWDIRQGAAAMKTGHLSEAAFLASRAIDINSEPAVLPSLYQGRGAVYAEGGQFAKADADFAKCVELQPNSAQAWSARVLLAWQLGGKDSYARTCGEMLARIAYPPKSNDARGVVWVCSLLPDAVSDFQQVVQLAEAAAAKDNSFNPAVLGAVHYRAGRFEEALKDLNYALGPPAKLRYAWEGYMLALAHHRLGHAEEAKLWLSRATAMSDQATKEDVDFRSSGRPYRWLQRLVAQILQREAEGLIQGAAK